MQVIKYILLLIALIPITAMLLSYGYHSLQDEGNDLTEASLSKKVLFWVFTGILATLCILGVGVLYMGLIDLFGINQWVLWSIIIGGIILYRIWLYHENQVRKRVGENIRKSKGG